jgi:hypothetical protein
MPVTEYEMNRGSVFLGLSGLALATASWGAEPAPLVLEDKIALGAVSGRIDHMALDVERRLLFVAELGNDSASVVDLDQRKVAHRLSGLREPQGLFFHRPTATLYVANGGDGSLRLYQGPQFTPVRRIELGDDADNIRFDARRNRIVVGYGSGALAVIDPASRTKVADIRLKAHPEAFQFDEAGERIFVNVPRASEISVVDVVAGKQVSALDPAGARSNFPMAVDREGRRVLAVFRSPAKIEAFGTGDGKMQASADTCDDADDVFVDAKRHRTYVSCGQGVIDVLAPNAAGYGRIARIPTVSGARTAFFSDELDRLYLAVRSQGREPAAIWTFRPEP